MHNLALRSLPRAAESLGAVEVCAMRITFIPISLRQCPDSTTVNSISNWLQCFQYESRLSAAIQILILYVDQVKVSWHFTQFNSIRLCISLIVNFKKCEAQMGEGTPRIGRDEKDFKRKWSQRCPMSYGINTERCQWRRQRRVSGWFSERWIVLCIVQSCKQTPCKVYSTQLINIDSCAG